MADTTPSTKAPTGLSISRDGLKFTFSWKCGASDYDAGQKFSYMVITNKNANAPSKQKWVSVDIGKKVRSKSVKLSASDYFPKTKKEIYGVVFRVRGRKGEYEKKEKKKKITYTPKWSEWSKKSIGVDEAKAIETISYSLSSDEDNTGTFSWTAPGDSGTRHFTDCQYQSTIVKEGAAVNWDVPTVRGTSTESGSVTLTEATRSLALWAFRRYVRVRARGAGGASSWKTRSHTYARPYTPRITGASFKNKIITVKWRSRYSGWHPIDTCTVYYALATPGKGLTCPSDVSWEEMSTMGLKQVSNEIKYSYSGKIGTDECMWVKVMAKHDRNETESAVKLVGVGTLSAPTLTSVEFDMEANTVTVEATNNSSVPDSFLAITIRLGSAPNVRHVIGIVPHGEESSSGIKTPNLSSETSYTVGVYACQGSYTSRNKSNGVTYYTVTANMKSGSVEQSGEIAHAPTNVKASSTETSGTIRVTWDWNWADADTVELAWSDHSDAWESTDEPETYSIDHKATAWNISGVETGTTYYVRVRFSSGSDEATTYSPWSEITADTTVDLSSAPSVPVLTLDAEVVSEGDTFTASWGYVSTDGTSQAYGEVCEAEVDGSTITYGDVIAYTESAQSVLLDVDELGWQTGSVHYLCCRVTSASYHTSDGWSAPVGIAVAEPPQAVIAETSLETVTVSEDDETGETREALSLTTLPLTATVSGAGEGGTTILTIERAESYQMERPDGSETDGFEGETVFTASQIGESAIEVTKESLLGVFDDGARYNIVATVEDSLGQSDTATLSFEVHWSHQAGMPSATVIAYPTSFFAAIYPVAPDNYEEGDTCDIYRLSADKPELIYEGAAYGQGYIDPYPALGMYGGHRIVNKTANGDYTTEDGALAWLDLDGDDGDRFTLNRVLIDFGGSRVELKYNLELDSSWEKDFERKTYLGGSVVGAWNPAVTRDASIGADTVITEDAETIRLLRELAGYAGVCHVRTPDGSSYSADIQVKESRGYGSPLAVAFDLSVQRIDPEEPDGMTLEEWKALGNELPDTGGVA